MGLLTLTAAMLYADQNLLAPNLSQAAEEFGFSEREKDVKLGGWLQLAFFVVGSPASLVIGWLADKPIPRTRLFFLTVLIGEGPCLATYWVKTYWQLFAVRAMTASRSAGACRSSSLCGDLFPPEERAYVASFLTIATGAGIALGQIMAGTVGPTYGWRLPFCCGGAAMRLRGDPLPTVKEHGAVAGGGGAARSEELRRSERGGHRRAAATYGSVGARRGDDDDGTAAAGANDERDTDGSGSTEGRSRRGRGDKRRTSRARSLSRDDGSVSSAFSSNEATHVTYGGKIDLAKLRRQLKIRSNLVILAQGLPAPCRGVCSTRTSSTTSTCKRD